MKTEFSDSNHILAPRAISFINCPLLEEYSRVKTKCWGGYVDGYAKYILSNEPHMKMAKALAHSHLGQVTTRMLDVYRDGGEHHYDDVCKRLGFYKGKDIDCWRSLVNKGLIKFSSKHARGRMYYTITPFGREVLGIVDANNVYYRVLRWFSLDGDEFIQAMVKADLSGDGGYEDQLPKAFINLFDALLDPKSRIREIGSAYGCMNKVISLINNNNEFYERATCPEVMKWINDNKDKSVEHFAFYSKVNSICRRKEKRAAKALAA